MSLVLPVYLNHQKVGVIVARGQTAAFTYGEAWLAAPGRFPLSLSMPLQHEPHGPDKVLPWLMNLLDQIDPQGATSRALGIAPENTLSVIAEADADLAGALVIGAREKRSAASNHIIKLDNPGQTGSVQNEALCMVLARRMGLGVAPVTTGRAGNRSYLLISRSDIGWTGEGVQSRHQEDFCQALGRRPAASFEFNDIDASGPSLREMFVLVRKHMTGRDLMRLLDAVIFNIAIGNGASHAMTYSILLGPSGAQLAPLHNLMTGIEEGAIQSHAQAIGGQRHGLRIYGRHWRSLAQEAGLSARGTIKRVGQVCARLVRELPLAVQEVAAMPAGNAHLDGLRKAIKTRASEVLAHSGEEGRVDSAVADGSG